MSLTLLTPPAAEPVSLAEAKTRLRIGDDAHDAAVTLWIKAARERVERDTGRALLSQVWVERRDGWTGDGQPDGRMMAFGTRFRLLRPPLIAVEAVTIYDAEDAPSEWDPAAFFVDAASDPGRIALRHGEDWPQPGRATGGIEIRFRCGYGDSPEDVPAPLREAVLQLVAAMADGGPETGMPASAASLIAPYRSVRL